jgi:hypothetical protein
MLALMAIVASASICELSKEFNTNLTGIPKIKVYIDGVVFTRYEALVVDTNVTVCVCDKDLLL